MQDGIFITKEELVSSLTSELREDEDFIDMLADRFFENGALWSVATCCKFLDCSKSTFNTRYAPLLNGVRGAKGKASLKYRGADVRALAQPTES